MPSIMAITYIESKEYQNISEAYYKVSGAKYKLISYMDDAKKMILPICKCLKSIMTVTNIGTEK